MKLWHFTIDLFSIDAWADEIIVNVIELSVNNNIFVLFQLSWDARPEVQSFIRICNFEIFYW